ncbi:hypothetical protein D7294_10975 [Streptomyces hoynatensis]|uniref:Uncharacterized protein n=2 Tax=Streptomyces hoynatensis TaxID=1141874 RepID=A0A3A9Z460_9ACTN|nr:hypothetical protein D7294_10975 [Streptomyces hoynatensis]
MATQKNRSGRNKGTTANPAQGVRIERLPSRPLQRTEAGRIALPLWVLNDGEHVGDGALVMTCDEAAELHREIGRLLATQPEEKSR